MNVKIVRLNYGDDIIGEVDFQSDVIVIDNPMSISIDVDRKNNIPFLKMKPWLPVYLVSDESVTFNYSDILSVFEPKSEIVEFYLQFISRSTESSKEICKSSMSKEDENFDSNVLLECILAKVENKIH
jgi:hypothetical protein